MYYPDERTYTELCSDNNLIPVFCDLPADTETPITVYGKVADNNQAYLLESVEGGEKMARYSFIGVEPFLTYRYHKGTGLLSREGNQTTLPGDPFQHISDLMQRFQAPFYPQAMRFYGGAVGYFGYDMVRHLENLPEIAQDDLDVPDCHFMIARVLLVFDHLRHSLRVVVNSLPGDDPQKSYHEAVSKLEEVAGKIKTGGPYMEFSQLSTPEKPPSPGELSNMSREEYMLKVLQAKEHIARGDILQVVLSQRFSVPFAGEPFQVYRRLRAVNPSPYLYFLNFGDVVIAGSSPEMLVRVEEGKLETRPIAGTRPRGADEVRDHELALEMLKDEKERAEHVMLVDLGRNDIGRVSAPGTVDVTQFMKVERYSHVMHLVSSVHGKLHPQHTSFDAIKACFPAGTVSGAPKVRAMEIIEELEPARRGPYAGAIGYLGFNGNIDTAITIRTILFYRGKAHVQAGAGIVADSKPEFEYQECLNKAAAMLQTIHQCSDAGSNADAGSPAKITREELSCCS